MIHVDERGPCYPRAVWHHPRPLLVVLALALAACDQSDFARQLLEKDGYTNVEVKKDGDHHYAFSGTNKQGQKCTGSMELRGNPSNYNSTSTVSCTGP